MTWDQSFINRWGVIFRGEGKVNILLYKGVGGGRYMKNKNIGGGGVFFQLKLISKTGLKQKCAKNAKKKKKKKKKK